MWKKNPAEPWCHLFVAWRSVLSCSVSCAFWLPTNVAQRAQKKRSFVTRRRPDALVTATELAESISSNYPLWKSKLLVRHSWELGVFHLLQFKGFATLQLKWYGGPQPGPQSGRIWLESDGNFTESWTRTKHYLTATMHLQWSKSADKGLPDFPADLAEWTLVGIFGSTPLELTLMMLRLKRNPKDSQAAWVPSRDTPHN